VGVRLAGCKRLSGVGDFDPQTVAHTYEFAYGGIDGVKIDDEQRRAVKRCAASRETDSELLQEAIDRILRDARRDQPHRQAFPVVAAASTNINDEVSGWPGGADRCTTRGTLGISGV